MPQLLQDQPIDPNALRQAFLRCCDHHGVGQPATRAAILDVLASPTVAELLELDADAEWRGVLVNDLYKCTMHTMYAAFMGGVACDFALHVRPKPHTLTLAQLARWRPHVMHELQAQTTRLGSPSTPPGVQPYAPCVLRALEVHGGGLKLPDAVVLRSEAQGVAPITWTGDRSPGDSAAGSGGPGQAEAHACTCVASGPVEAASHAETTVMQLVQAAMLTAQVESIQDLYAWSRQRHADAPPSPSPPSSSQPTAAALPAAWPDRSELLGSSLAHLAHVVDRLNGAPPHGLSIMLFAGRRASDRLFLVLQNLVFARLVRGYCGTSSVYAATLLNLAWDALGARAGAEPVGAPQRLLLLGPLVGTHAHEQSSVAQQLLADLDLRAGQAMMQQPQVGGSAGGTAGPAAMLPLSSVLVHLLLLAATPEGCPDPLRHGGATALPDTFGTAPWLRVALAADVPRGFAEHVWRRHGHAVPSGAKCFDLFRFWRVDSGDYAEVAGLIADAWEWRCGQLAPTAASASGPSASSSSPHAAPGPNPAAAPEPSGAPAQGPPLPPRPQFIHSNLGSVDEVLEVAQLPERVRPSTVAFGTLADGYLPLIPPCPLTADQPSAPATGQGSCTPGVAASPPEPAAGTAPPTLLPPVHLDGSGRPVLHMASVVMKAVQARAAKVAVTQPSAFKMGDPESGGAQQGAQQGSVGGGAAQQHDASKVEMDPRLSAAERAHMLALVAGLRRSASASGVCAFEASGAQQVALSALMEEGWRRVVVEGLLQE